LDGDAPLPSAGAYDVIEIGGFRDLLVIDRDHDVALLEADRLRRRAVGDADDDDALALRIEPQLVGERRRKVGDGGAAERRTRADFHFVAWRFGNALQRDGHGHLPALPDDTDLRAVTQRLGGKAVIEGIGIVDDRAVDADDQVAGLDTGAGRGTAGSDVGDQGTARPLQPEAFGDLRRHALELGAEPWTLDRSAAALGGRNHHPYHVRRNGEADALRAAGTRIDRGVDADEPAFEIDQSAAGISRIDRGVGLDEELIIG